MIANKKHIIFDWNGTLVNDAEAFVDVLNAMLVPRKLSTINIKQYRNLFCFPIKKFYSELGVDVSKKSFHLLEKQFVREYRLRMFNPLLFPGVVNILQKLIHSGISLSILSASHQKILNQLINHYHLRKYFVHVFGVNNFSAEGKLIQGKKLMGYLNYNNDELVYVGDTDQDYFVSKKLKIHCILVSGGHQSRDRLKQVSNAVVDSLDKLLIS